MTIEQRLQRLERSNNRWRAACLLSGMCLLGTIALGQAQKPRALPAQKVDGRLVVDELVVQENGKDRIMLIARDGNTMVAQLDDRGEPLIVLGTGKGAGPFVSMRDTKGRTRLTTTVTDEGTAVTHHDAMGRDRLTTSTVDGGVAYTMWHDVAGQSRVTCAARTTQGLMTVADAQGTTRVMLSTTGAGASIVQQDAAGRVRLAESVEDNQVLRLLYDQHGRPRLKSVQIGEGEATTYYLRPDDRGGSTLLNKLP